ncbi:MAG: 16S rRNA (guanine(527)-N(7))-methyltransferase [uncultured Sphingosinicella sp.]|uniref:Ribosomal RNA small subunit methyltransferase G n=1 Tax=uncultured Sphingosinicella sp. TaxID=478748 RepID=A0A6J4U9X3_9SPHN|nr:16S rRNA (guanine(527)-N(7))-methyltransferase RsmG [uncultured Sphingosinicella sp.]CAA9544281.1 MAG: 16S rRNA (guanine(527)-N(7))-methyltransferase [uncultured Sphingosinicella sp.]
MEEAKARLWLEQELGVPRETMERLGAFVELLRRENEVQNLVSKITLDQIWTRHIVDSAQLLRLASGEGPRWLDLGTGAGFPGLVIALLYGGEVTMVEARRLRVDFLSRAAQVLQLQPSTQILCAKVERLEEVSFGVISARAFAPLDRLLSLGERFASPETRWVLPKGRNAKSELEDARASWQGDFRLEQSLTDPDAWIIVAENVRRRVKGKRGK